MRFAGRRLKQRDASSGKGRLSRLRRVPRVPPLGKVSDSFEPPPLPCGDYTLHLHMAESSFGLEDRDAWEQTIV